MTKYRPWRELLAEIDITLSEPNLPSSVPLERAIAVLIDGRSYASAAIALAANSRNCAPPTAWGKDIENSSARITTPIEVPGRILGYISVEPGSRADRVPLKHVARRLAIFLTGRGKRFLLAARTQVTDAIQQN